MLTAIIDYGSGNLRSAAKAFERAAGELDGGERVIVTSDADEAAHADRIVLPGQGAFADCRRGLAAVPGLEDAIADAVIGRGRPFFGICVGMQLMAERGREFETVEGLGWVGGEIVPIEPADPSFKIPHMGWNQLALERSHPVFDGIAEGTHSYFVHSFHFAVTDRADLIATADYAQALTAAIGRDNMVGTQFHPEKSQAAGLRLIANFLKWRP
ncbi:MAG TPA: imidazole glycerol phosphate synthase subunit HisH [Stellaceae bacterium]|jgi:glutamine amidotransferase|nr:imidazole glycerol phosphate synthase subunit HisH [Stellaceae bacterium]